MKKQINWYVEAIESVLIEQRCEIAELEAEIAYLESSRRKSKATYKMIAELKQQLAKAVDGAKKIRTYKKMDADHVTA